MTSRQQHGVVSAAGRACAEGVCGIGIPCRLDIFHDIDDILHGGVMAAGERFPRRAAEVRVDEIPIIFNAPLFDGGGVLMAVAPAPWMEDDEQRSAGLAGGMSAGGLLRLIV